LVLINFSQSTPISCGARAVSINAHVLGKDVVEIVKCALQGWQSDLMNRFIHRSWGESFVNIFLDLSIDHSLLLLDLGLSSGKSD